MPSNGCCINSCYKPDFPNHGFPITYPKAFEIWVERVGRPHLKTIERRKLKSYRVCHKHFLEECRIPNSKRLKVNSLPTLFLPGYSGEADIENSFLPRPDIQPIVMYNEHNYSTWFSVREGYIYSRKLLGGVPGTMRVISEHNYGISSLPEKIEKAIQEAKVVVHQPVEPKRIFKLNDSILSGVFGINGHNLSTSLLEFEPEDPQAPATSDVPTVSTDLPPLPPLKPFNISPAKPLGLPKFGTPQQQRHENTIILSGLTITEVDEDDEPIPAEESEGVETPQESSGESSSLEINNLICRICKGERKEMISLFSHEVFSEEQRQIFEIIQLCASVQIIRDDGLPQFACLKCLAELHQAFKFRQLCEKTDAELRKEFEKDFLRPTETVLEPEAEKDIDESEVISDALKENVPINTLKRGRLKQDVLFNVQQAIEKNPINSKNRKFVLVKLPKNTTENKQVSQDNILVTSSNASENRPEQQVNTKQSEVSTEPINKKCESGTTEAIIEELDSIINNPEYEMDISQIQNVLPLVNFGLTEADGVKEIQEQCENIKPKYSCKLCGSNYNDIFELQTHMKLHANKPKKVIKSSLKPFLQFNKDSFKCKICKKSFKRPVTNAHMREQHGRKDTVYKCLKCNIKYRSLEKLRQHLRSHKSHVGSQADSSKEAPMVDMQVDS